MKKGALITLYGINNIGKTTHALRLVERLKSEGFQAQHVKYPVYDLEPTGSFINHVLRSGEKQNISEEELQLWYVLNRFQNEKQLEEWLQDGVIVVAEDYCGTGIAWGTAKGGDQEWLIAMNKHLRKEDFAILMRGKRALSAKEAVHAHEQNDDLVEKCRLVHEELGEKWGWIPVDVQEKKSDTAELIWLKVKKFLESR